MFAHGAARRTKLRCLCFFRLRGIRVILQECVSFVDRANYTRSCNRVIESFRGDNLIERCFMRAMDAWSLFPILVAVAHCAREGEEQLSIKLVMRSKIYSSSSRRIRKYSRSKTLFRNCRVHSRTKALLSKSL